MSWTIQERIKNLRVEHKLTLKELAEQDRSKVQAGEKLCSAEREEAEIGQNVEINPAVDITITTGGR